MTREKKWRLGIDGEKKENEERKKNRDVGRHCSENSARLGNGFGE